MRKGSVDTPTTQRMGVALRTITNLLFRDITSPDTSISMEETLVGRQTVLLSQRLTLCSVLISSIGHLQTTVICKVLTQGQTTVGL